MAKNNISVGALRGLLAGLDDVDILLFRSVPGTFHIAHQGSEGDGTSFAAYSIDSLGVLDCREERIVPPDEIENDESLSKA